MCGRLTLRTAPAAWIQDFLPNWSADEIAIAINQRDLTARFNIAPTQDLQCIRSSDSSRRTWMACRWGLVPAWANDLSIGNRMINARSETVHEKRSFAKPFLHQRCLIPADGYYEWQSHDGGKQPFLIERTDQGMLAMAGLWESNSKLGQDDQPLLTCTVLTTSANQNTRSIHERMPVFLDSSAQAIWMDADCQDKQQLQTLLQPAPEDWLRLTPVSKKVNRAGFDSPECVEPIALPDETMQQRQGTLFD